MGRFADVQLQPVPKKVANEYIFTKGIHDYSTVHISYISSENLRETL